MRGMNTCKKEGRKMFKLVCKECGNIIAFSSYGGFMLRLLYMPPPFCPVCEFNDYELREPHMTNSERCKTVSS